MAKKPTTVYVSEEFTTQLRDRGFVLSQIAESAFEIAAGTDFEDLAVKMRLDTINNDIEETKKRLVSYRVSMAADEARLVELEATKSSTSSEWEYAKKVARTTALMRQINQIIWAADYDEELIKEKGGEFISKLLTYNPNFDLPKHIIKLRKLLST